MFRIPIRSLLLLGFLIAACTPSSTPPSINSPVQPVNVEACRHTSLSLKNFNAKSLRDLVTCLNGDHGAIQPYKDFLDEMNTGDLNQLLEIYNKHIYGTDNRLNETLDLLDKLHKRGALKSLMTDIQVMTETGTAEKLLPVVSRLFESDSDPGVTDPNLKGFNQLVVRLIDDQMLSPDLIAAADAFGGLRAKVLAALISKSDVTAVLNSDQVVDLLSNQLLSAFDDGTFHALVTHLSDPNLNPPAVLGVLSDAQLSDLGGLFDYLTGAVTGTPGIGPLQQLIAAGDQPLVCFRRGSQARVTSNIDKFIATQAVKHADGADIDRYMLKDLPLLLSATEDGCSYPAAVVNNFPAVEDIARQGFANGHKDFDIMTLSGHRYEEEMRFVSSPYVVGLAPIFEEGGLRGATPFMLQLLGKDLSRFDAGTLAATLNDVATGDLQGQQLTNWISNSMSAGAAGVLLNDLKQIPANRRSLITLSLYAAADPSQDAVLRELKSAVAQGEFTDSFETPVVAIAKKMLKNQGTRRQELKDLVHAFVASMADSRGGAGDMLGVIAQAVELSKSTPVQKILHDTLADQRLVDSVVPVLYKVTRDPKFADVVRFTGQLAGNGQLEKLITFVAELLRSTDSPGLDPNPYSRSFMPAMGDPAVLAASARRTTATPPVVDYSSCENLHGSMFEPDGSNVDQALQCVNTDGGFPGLAQTGDDLAAAKVLPQAASVFGTLAASSPYLFGTLGELQSLFDSGDLDRLLQLAMLSAQSPFNLTTGADGILAGTFNHSELPLVLKTAGKVAQLDDLSVAGPAAVKVLTATPQKTFFSNNGFRLKLHDPAGIKAKIHALMPNLNDQQLEQVFETARENFETHNDAWKYEEGPYPKLNDAQWKAYVIRFLQDSLRTTDLEQLVSALQAIGRDLNPAQFLSQSIDDQRVALHYSDDGTPHVHIVTLLDQLEELVLDADFQAPMVNHVGVNFQLSVVDASNLSSAMRQQHTYTEVGLRMWAEPLHKVKETARFKSMLSNYDGLQQIADNGQLRIFQDIYRGLYNATPAQYQRTRDPVLNHMGMAFLVNKVGLFSNLTMSLANAKAQGQLERIVNGLFGLAQLIGPKDMPPLRAALGALLASTSRGNDMPLDLLLNKFLTVEQNAQGYQNLKDALFQLVPALTRLNVEPTGIFEAVPPLVRQPRAWNDLLDKILADGSSPQSDLLDVTTNLSQVDENSMQAFRKIAELLFTDDPATGHSGLAAAAAVAADGYAARPDDYSRLWTGYKAYENDPRVVALKPAELLIRAFNELAGQSGLGDELGAMLLDSGERQDIIDVGRALAQNGDVARLFSVFSQLIGDGSVDSGLHFVFDNLTPSSVGSISGVRR